MTTHGRILIVDDDAAARNALQEILATEGYQVDTAHDGLSALAKLSEFRPDLVLSDMSMPRMDGATFIARARQRGIPFQLVIMTACDAARDMAATIGADYVPKPIDLTKLLQVVSDAMKASAPTLSA